MSQRVQMCPGPRNKQFLCKFMSVFLNCKTGLKIATCGVGGFLEGADKLVIDEHTTSMAMYFHKKIFVFHSFFAPNKENKNFFFNFSLVYMKHKDSEVYAVIKASDGGDMRNYPKVLPDVNPLRIFPS